MLTYYTVASSLSHNNCLLQVRTVAGTTNGVTGLNMPANTEADREARALASRAENQSMWRHGPLTPEGGCDSRQDGHF